jgi:hypothetical protein
MSADHGRLLRNTVLWALNEESIAEVIGPGVVDVTVWRQQHSMTVHLVNMTNPMMMKGPFRELIPVSAQVSIKIPSGMKASGVHLLVNGGDPKSELKENRVVLTVPQIYDHEIIGIDLV